MFGSLRNFVYFCINNEQIIYFKAMKIERISVAFVGVYNAIQPMIPGLDNKFCRHLYNNPDDTINGMSPDGYTISINNRPLPMVVINSQKIIFKSENIDTLTSYVCKVKQEFGKIGFGPQYAAFGINYEYQFLDLNDKAESWINNKFLRPDIFGGKEKKCNVLSLRFDIDDSERVNMLFEPRVGIHNGVFMSINHHHASFLDELPKEDTLRDLFKQSESKIKNDFLPFFKH